MIKMRIFVVSILFILPSGAFSQDANTCQNLLDAGLISQTSETVNRTIASHNFDDFCKIDKDYASRFSGKSQAFQASFSYAGFGISGGAASARSTGNTENKFRQVCQKGKQSFLSNFTRSFAARDGSAVANAYNNCLKIILNSGTPVLWGTVTRTQQNDRDFLIQLQYYPGRNTPSVDLFISNILTSPNSVKCFIDQARKKDISESKPALNGTLTLSCTKPVGVDVAGMIIVENRKDGYRHRPLVFQLPTTQVRASVEAKIMSEIVNLKNKLSLYRDKNKRDLMAAITSSDKKLSNSIALLNSSQVRLKTLLRQNLNSLRIKVVSKGYSCNRTINSALITCPVGWFNTGAIFYNTEHGGSCGRGYTYNLCVQVR